MMKDWTDIIGEELEKIEEPLPADDWIVLQHKLAVSIKRKRTAAFAWAGGFMSVAAIALVLLLVRPDSDSIIISDSISETTELIADTHIKPIEQNISVVLVAKSLTPTNQSSKTDSETSSEAEPLFDVVRDTVEVKDFLIADASMSNASISIPDVHQTEKYKGATGTLKFEDFPDEEPMRPRRLISFGMSGSVAGTPSINIVYNDMMIPDSSLDDWYENAESAGPKPIDPEPPLVADPELPTEGDTLNTYASKVRVHMMRSKSSYQESYEHELPVSVGISARFHLSDRMTLNTGLNYTRYRSTRTRYSSGLDRGTTDVQKVHYVGIPLRLDWLAVDKKNFNLYLGAGIQADKCIYATVGDERLHEKQVLLSAAFAAGLQFNISPRVGVYFEPEVSYSINEGSLETFRTEEPNMISARVGLRFTLH